MKPNVEITIIRKENRFLVKELIERLGDSKRTFRYFNNRTVDALDNHLYTIIAFYKNQIAGYGHLDHDQEKYWLGIVVIEGFKGMGIGSEIMNNLFSNAKKNKLKTIKLSVDNDNIIAKNLYLNMGFLYLEQKENYSILIKSME